MGKSVFITGAAAGIGRATARRFAELGYTVGGYDLDEAGLATLATEITALGGTPVTGHLDVTDYAELSQRITEFTAATGGRLDLLINNAGILRSGRFPDIDITAQQRMIDINCKGVTNGCHAAYPALRDTPGATVINLCSASAIYGQPELAVYSASKFFVRGLTEALDLEWGADDIRVIAMWPLYVQTAMTDGVHTGTTASLGVNLTAEDVVAAIVAAAEPGPLQRLLHVVHFPVGRQTARMAGAVRFSPAWLTRLVNKRLARL